jgi:hypothetical protein
MAATAGTAAHHPQKCGERRSFQGINRLRASRLCHNMLRLNGRGGTIHGVSGRYLFHRFRFPVDIGGEAKEVRQILFHSPKLVVEAAGT